MITKLEDLHVYNLSLDLAMQVFELSKNFPIAEKYSLTSQLTRAARSVPLNIAEGWGRGIYSNEIKKSLVYSQGSVEETKTALELAYKCNFITEERFNELYNEYKKVAAQLYKLYWNWGLKKEES